MNPIINKLLLIIFLIAISCKEKKANDMIANENNQKNMTLLEKVLSSQLSSGADYISMESDVLYTSEDTEFEVAIQIIDSLLLSNNYEKLTEKIFEEKLKKIFGEKLINDFSNQDIIHFDITDEQPQCLHTARSRESNYFYQEGSESTGFHIVKSRQIISNFYYLPELIDYQKEYPKIAKLEEKEFKYYDELEEDTFNILRWKDIGDLPQQRKFNIQLLIHRNKYLFNDSKASLTWLMNNDADFIESLVKIFGYVEDKKLLKWVIDRNRYQGGKEEEFGKLLWTRDCSNKIQFHNETLEVIKENMTSTPMNYLDDLLGYIEYLRNDKNQEEISLTFEEKAMIIAHILYFGQKLADEKEYLNYKFRVMGFFYKHYDNENKYDKEFTRQEYYHLPKFKELWEEAKYFGDGLDLPM